MQAEANRLKQETKKKEQQVNRFNLKTVKTRSNNLNNPVPTYQNQKKKIDNLNSDYIRYVSERDERKTTSISNTPQQAVKNQE